MAKVDQTLVLQRFQHFLDFVSLCGNGFQDFIMKNASLGRLAGYNSKYSQRRAHPRRLTMKLLTTILLSILSTIGVTGTGVTIVTRDSKEPPSTAMAVHTKSSSNLTPKTDKGEALPKVALVKNLRPVVPPEFWDKLAQCETGGNWTHRGGHGDGRGLFGGGIGIMSRGKFGDKDMGTWERWGGEQFAPSPDKATKEQQIIVANRIAVYGWKTKIKRDPVVAKRKGIPVVWEYVKKPTGFNGWGCLNAVGGTPHLLTYRADTVIAQKFRWGQKGEVVKDLQSIIGVYPDGEYGFETWAAHQRYVIKHKLSRANVPAAPFKMPKKNKAWLDKSKRCPQYEKALYNAGFPAKQVPVASYVMWKESRCQLKVHNAKDPSGGSYGLMQVNGVWIDRLQRLGIIEKTSDLYDPEKNIAAAFDVWLQSVARYNYGWGPWGIY